eukprot:3515096-Pyramimonas_sp.AAC.1
MGSSSQQQVSASKRLDAQTCNQSALLIILVLLLHHRHLSTTRPVRHQTCPQIIQQLHGWRAGRSKDVIIVAVIAHSFLSFRQLYGRRVRRFQNAVLAVALRTFVFKVHNSYRDGWTNLNCSSL